MDVPPLTILGDSFPNPARDQGLFRLSLGFDITSIRPAPTLRQLKAIGFRIRGYTYLPGNHVVYPVTCIRRTCLMRV